jgi:diguanylate cyclase (GGDEF)-like protein
MLDMGQRLRAADVAAIAAFTLLALAVIPTAGLGLLGAAVVGGGFFASVIARLARSRRPEYLSVALVAVGEVAIAGGILASTGPRILMVVLLTGPMLIGASVWPQRAVVVGALGTALLMVGVALAVDAHGVALVPARVVYPIGVLLSTVVVASASRDADVASRASAVVDRLTGLLNRGALMPHAAELAHQSALTGQPVALLLGDIDHFKDVNDRHGHGKGDEVLAALAARLREAMGRAGTIYRFGGEEFVALLPGADRELGVELAESLRRAVACDPVAGLALTISFGVAAAAEGVPFDFEALFAAADHALYEAKGAGRDCVRAAAPQSAHTGEQRRAPLARTREGAHGRARARRTDPAGWEGWAARETTAGEAAAAPAGQSIGADEPARASARAPASAEGARLIAERLAHQHAVTGSWLVRDDAARAHMLDFLHRIRRVRILAYALVLASLIAGGPFFGWLPILPPLSGAVAMGVTIDHSSRMRRPELAIGAAICYSLVAAAAGFLLSHSSPFVALPLLVVLVFAWSPVFPAQGVAVGTAIAVALVVGSAIAIGAHTALSDPVVIGVPLALLVAAAAIGAALGRSSIDHRSASIVDQLTGMLARRALDARVATVAHEASYSQEPVALIVADIDHFKQVNDREGHRTGDEVLCGVSQRMRECLRAFEACYRIGGEEFVVLLPGMGAGEAARVAERLREGIRGRPIEGIAVTMSFGVAACERGETFDYDELFGRADAGLYEAKRSGRDRVSVGAPAPHAPSPQDPSSGASASELAAAA